MRHDPASQKLLFPTPLVEGRIIARPNRFIAIAEVDGVEVKAHCPVTGAIGGFPLAGLPCLLSVATPGAKRTTTHTLEAIAVEEPTSSKFQWIGINQTAVNRYIEAALGAGYLDEIASLRGYTTLKREPRLGESRLDFLLDSHIYVEVKTPVKNLQVDLPQTLIRTDKTATGTDRMLRQVEELMGAMADGDKAVLLIVFVYDNPGFQVPQAHNKTYSNTVATMQAAADAGMERWQINFELDPTGVRVNKVLNLN